MSYDASFYDNKQDLDKEGNPKLYFKLFKASTACKNAQPLEFDGPATPEQIKFYSREFSSYMEAKAPVAKEEPAIELSPSDMLEEE